MIFYSISENKQTKTNEKTEIVMGITFLKTDRYTKETERYRVEESTLLLSKC